MGIIIAIICSILAIIAVIYFKNQRYKYYEFVKNNSISLKRLSEINHKYDFCNSIQTFDQKYTYDNEANYNNISCEDYLIYQLQFIKYDVKKAIKSVQYNADNFAKYKNELSKIQKFGQFSQSHGNLNYNKLIDIEYQSFNRLQLHPKTNLSINVTLYCSNINGYVYDSKSESFSIEQIETLIKRLENKNRDFFNDKEIWNSICRIERGKVSNKMRFAIYERDGYRCQICGRDENDDILEIDHIKPISKGGKSEFNNLQTLCRRCNKNKSNNY